MAQLIKLYDYISRYESDIFQYTSRFIRFKRQGWESKKKVWTDSGVNDQDFPANMYEEQILDEDWLKEENRTSILKSIKLFFARTKKEQKSNDYSNEQGTPTINTSLDELKQDFLDELLDFQFNWASSTIQHRSFLDNQLFNDKDLLFFLQSFPDNYLVMYRPVFMVKNAPLEAEIILLSPVTTYCITILTNKRDGVFQADKGRFWNEGHGENIVKHINPIISLNRIYTIVENIYNKNNIEIPIRKVVLCRNGFIEQPYFSFNTDYIDNRNFQEWHSKMKRLPSPLKAIQVKGAEALLAKCQSTYVKRQEWEEKDEF